jgi:hypothetical protein
LQGRRLVRPTLDIASINDLDGSPANLTASQCLIDGRQQSSFLKVGCSLAPILPRATARPVNEATLGRRPAQAVTSRLQGAVEQEAHQWTLARRQADKLDP